MGDFYAQHNNFDAGNVIFVDFALESIYCTGSISRKLLANPRCVMIMI
jgi:hypothetical protein